MKKMVLVFFLLCAQLSLAQHSNEYSSTEIYHKIEKLNFLGSVLYVGAHPDDENTALISYLSNKTNARVAYLSMTRGDGGQNLIGPEIRESLGVIRTEELLAARRVDGGKQFFTTANDFGYSKNPEETFRIWDKQQVLSDVVWVFRKFRPDVVINRFDHRTEGDTHGHHTASARLSVKAFDLSGVNTKYPKQLTYHRPWQPKKLYLNISWLKYGHPEQWKAMDKSQFLQVDLGSYLPMRGLSNSEIAALSRSQHKSQGFGVMSKRGTEIDYLERIKGDFPSADTSIFAGINTSWSRLENGKPIGEILSKVQREFDFRNPAASLPGLLKAYRLIKKLHNPHWRNVKLAEIKSIITACSGLYLQASSAEQFGVKGTSVSVNIEAINRSRAKMEVTNVTFSGIDSGQVVLHQELKTNRDFQQKVTLQLPKSLQYTSPYWLRAPHGIGMYQVDKQPLIGLPETPPQVVASFDLVINGTQISFQRPVVYKTSTPAKGEVEKPFAIVPKVSLQMAANTLIFPDETPKTIAVSVKAFADEITGSLRLQAPDNWTIEPKTIPINLTQKGKQMTVTFTVTPPDEASTVTLLPIFEMGNQQFTKQVQLIDYPHIRTQTVLLPTETKALRLAIETRGEYIAYIPGSGDAVAESLREIGYSVSLLPAKELSTQNLSRFDAIIIGIRAYNTDKYLALNQEQLFDYIAQGGTVITQYNKSYGLKTKKLSPYPLQLSHQRVTDEKSKVSFLAPNHPVLTTPNRITKNDFKGWVQERGLYFPSQWSTHFTPILGMHDHGEPVLKSSLLVAKYGKGYFVYTGLSFFRELPAGVAGAFRLFANLIALGNH